MVTEGDPTQATVDIHCHVLPGVDDGAPGRAHHRGPSVAVAVCVASAVSLATTAAEVLLNPAKASPGPGWNVFPPFSPDSGQG